jgi:CRISPR-associated protein Csm2
MNFVTDFKTKWITGKLEPEAIDYAEQFGKYLCDLQGDRPGRMALTTSQIRNFFGEIKRIQGQGYDKERTAFLLIRPKLAYAEARILSKSGKTRMSDFRKVVESAHNVVSTAAHFKNFVDFLEAILAYHKASGGRD